MKLSVKFVLIILLSFLLSEFVFSQVKVKGYTRNDGTYVKPHVRSNPDGNPYNNWSYPGNTNPYTGKTATGSSDAYLRNYNNNSTSTGGEVNVSGYYKSDGTNIQPHKRSASDGNPYNNWSYPGNANPHTDKTATGNSTTYLNNYYNSSSSTYDLNNHSSDVDWKEIKKESGRFWKEDYPQIKAEQDKFWREEYPKIKKENDLFFNSNYSTTTYNTSNSSYKIDQAVKYHYRYSQEDRVILELVLQKLGYYIGTADGVFDENTINGIKKFQSTSGVKADGKIGQNTMNQLQAEFN